MNSTDTGNPQLDRANPLVDLSVHPWEALLPQPDDDLPKDVDQRTDWEPIRVGRRWEKIGRHDLNKRVVWVRTRFHVAEEIANRRFDFLATAFDDIGRFM